MVSAGLPGVVAQARIEPISRFEAEQQRLRELAESAPKAYEDNYMSSDEAAQWTGQDARAKSASDKPGLRSWLLESRAGYGQASSTGHDSRNATEFGLRAEYRLGTLNFGEFVLQADARALSGDRSTGFSGLGALGHARNAQGGRFTVRNLGAPVTTRHFVDAAVGDIYSEVTPGLSRNWRISYSTSMVRGAAVRVFGRDFDLRAGLGRRGRLTGGPFPGYEEDGGASAWLGATWSIDPRWVLAAQFSHATQLSAWRDAGGGGGIIAHPLR